MDNLHLLGWQSDTADKTISSSIASGWVYLYLLYCICYSTITTCAHVVLHITHVVLAVSLFPPGLTANAPYRKANHLNKYNTGDTIREECEECQTPHRVITFTALEMFAQSVPRLSETRFIWQCTRYVIVYMYECTV